MHFTLVSSAAGSASGAGPAFKIILLLESVRFPDVVFLLEVELPPEAVLLLDVVLCVELELLLPVFVVPHPASIEAERIPVIKRIVPFFKYLFICHSPLLFVFQKLFAFDTFIMRPSS